MAKKLLKESWVSPNIKCLVESKSDGRKVYVVKGEFGRHDRPTNNKRMYGRGLYERECKSLQNVITNRRLLGEADHPDDGKTKLTRVSHLITKLEVKEDGSVYGEAELLDTPAGKILKALYEQGVQIGVSSRGHGTTTPGPNGIEEVNDDFQLKTFDFVINPAMASAYPDAFVEAEEEAEFSAVSLMEELGLVDEVRKYISESEQPKSLEESASEEPLTEDSIKETLAQAVSSLRDEVTESVRAELLANPEIGGAKSVLEAVAGLVRDFSQTPDEMAVADALKAKDLKISTLKQRQIEMEEALKKSVFNLKIERTISGHPHRVLIRSLMENSHERYATPEALVQALEKVLEKVEKVPVEQTEAEKELSELQVKFKEISELKKQLQIENAELESELERLEETTVERGEYDSIVELNQALEEDMVQLKAEADRAKLMERKALAVSRSVNRTQMDSILESAQSTEEIDRLEETFSRSEYKDPDLEAFARKARGRSGGSPLLQENGVADLEIAEKGPLSAKWILQEDEY